MANEWTRLTPEDVLDIAPVEYGVLERRWHLLQTGCAEFALTPGELLALVIVTEVWREVAEVQALVRHLRAFIIDHTKGGKAYCRDCGAFLVDGHDKTCASVTVLAPFQEPADA